MIVKLYMTVSQKSRLGVVALENSKIGVAFVKEIVAAVSAT